MAAQGILTNPQLIINGETYPIVPNSLKIEVGRGTKSVKVQAAGDSLQVVVSDNLEDAISQITFSIYTTIDNFQNFESVRSNIGNNIVEIICDSSTGDDTLTLSASDYTVTDKVTYEFKSEGVAEITMQGSMLT